MTYRYAPYPHTRFWAFYKDDNIVAVTAYRKGCEGIADLIKQLQPDAVIEPYDPPKRSHAERVSNGKFGATMGR